MTITIPAAIRDRWVPPLELLAKQDAKDQGESYSDFVRMTPTMVLKFLLPRQAIDGVVTLSCDDDDKWAKSVIANAERLTGIKVDQDE